MTIMLLVERNPDGSLVPWLFENTTEGAAALDLFHAAGLDPDCYTGSDVGPNDAEEVRNALRERGLLGEGE